MDGGDRRLSRRQLIGGALAVGGLAGAQAAFGPAAGASALRRPTSLPFPRLAAGTDTMPKIEHVVVLMMENHSFDDHLGMLGRATG